jgi:capsular polysaccharide biosynthesis protein
MNETTTDASAIFAPIWRRKWLILAVAILVAAGSYEYYKRKPSTFAVKTELYLGGASEGQALLNNTLGKTNLSATAIANQVQLITTTIAEVVHKQLRKEHSRAAAGGKVKAKAAAGSEFITISAEAATARGAAELANDYARAYIRRHQANFERSVNTAITDTRRQIHRIEAAQLAAKPKAKSPGSTSSASAGAATTLQIASMSTKLNELESDLSVTGVQQVSVAKPGKAELVGPAPKKNAIFGFAIGLILATLIAYIVSRFDRRLRSLHDIDVAFQASY